MNKECKKCGEIKPPEDFPKYKGKIGNILRRGACKKCHNKAHLLYLYGNKERTEKKKQYDKKWRYANPEKVKAYRENQKDNMKKYTDCSRKNLTDTYIRNRLGTSVVNQDLIKAKRLQIQIQRLLEKQGYEKRCRVKGRFS